MVKIALISLEQRWLLIGQDLLLPKGYATLIPNPPEMTIPLLISLALCYLLTRLF